MASEHPTKDEILALETAYWDALRRKDGAAAARLSADPSVVTGRQGVATISREKMKALSEDATWTLDDYTFEEVTFVSPTRDVAIIAYTVTQTVTMNGKADTRRAADSSTWTRGPDGWTCCAHSEAFLE